MLNLQEVKLVHQQLDRRRSVRDATAVDLEIVMMQKQLSERMREQ